MKTALLAGSTGLIGRALLKLLLDSPEYNRVVAITRTDLTPHPKLHQVNIRWENMTDQKDQLIADDVFCCLGTTIAAAGTQEKFHEVDFRYPYDLAKATHALGAKQYLLVSALGADVSSSIYYNRVKGEVEQAIRSVGFETLHIFRPSLLLGDRQEKRPGEEAAKFFYALFGILIPRKYKAIHSQKVAAAMLHFASQPKSGNFIHESAVLHDF